MCWINIVIVWMANGTKRLNIVYCGKHCTNTFVQEFEEFGDDWKLWNSFRILSILNIYFCLFLKSFSHNIDSLEFCWIGFGSFHLDQCILLWADPFSRLSVVVHTRLAILRREDGVTFAKLDLVLLLQGEEVPPDKWVVVRVGIRGDEGSSPVRLRVDRTGEK